MAKINVNIDEEMGEINIDAKYDDLDDFVASAINLTTCLIYEALDEWNLPANEEAEQVIDYIKNIICSYIANHVSLDGYKEFCNISFSCKEESNIYHFMEEVYEEWLTSLSITENELIYLCRNEPLDLKIQKNNNGNIEILLVKKNDEQVIENLKSINTGVGDEILDNVA